MTLIRTAFTAWVDHFLGRKKAPTSLANDQVALDDQVPDAPLTLEELILGDDDDPPSPEPEE